MGARCWLFLLFGMSACGLRTPEQHERDWAQAMTPKSLVPARPAPTAPRFTVRVQVWVDAAYSSQNPNYEQRVRSLIERASRFAEAAFATRFEVVGVGSWEHPREDRLVPLLDQLAREHQPADVDLVLGFTSSLQLFTSTFEDLGQAHLFGRYAVLRGIDAHQQSDVIINDLKRLDVSEKLAVVRARVEHQETAVFLHEWGHSRGALHDRDLGFIMSPQYSDSQREFSPASTRSVELGLEYLERDDRLAEWLARAQTQLRSVAPNQLEPGAAESVARLFAAPDGGSPAPADLERPLTDDDRKLFNIAVEKASAGKAADALWTLRGLVARRARHPQVQTLACRLAVAAKPTDPAAQGQCVTAMGLSPSDPRPALALAWAKASTKDEVGTREAALEARRRASLGTREPELQAELARSLLAAGELDAAEQEARLAEMSLGAQQVLEDIAFRRRPPQPSTAPASPGGPDCAAQAAAVARTLQGALSAKTRAQAAALGRACPRSGRALYLLGVIDEADNLKGSAIEHFDRSIAAEPRNEDAWRRLARLYAATRMTAAREELARKFRQAFGRELD